MAKRKDIIKKIRKEAKTQGVTWDLAREGSNHEVYRLGSTMIPIPRHTEIGEGLTEQIYKQAEAELGRRWWR